MSFLGVFQTFKRDVTHCLGSSTCVVPPHCGNWDPADRLAGQLSVGWQGGLLAVPACVALSLPLPPRAGVWLFQLTLLPAPAQ